MLYDLNMESNSKIITVKFLYQKNKYKLGYNSNNNNNMNQDLLSCYSTRHAAVGRDCKWVIFCLIQP